MDQEPKKPICAWCGGEVPARFCPTCKAPRGPTAFWLFGFNKFATALAIPLAIVATTFLLSTLQERAAQSRSDHEKLLSALVDFARVHSDFRVAANTIDFLDLQSAPVPAKDLKAAVLDLDRAFESLGAKLTPFEDAEAQFHPAAPASREFLQIVWDDCFSHEYFEPKTTASEYEDKRSDWEKIQSQLHSCNAESCPAGAAHTIKSIVDQINAPHCNTASKDFVATGLKPNQDFGVIWYVLGGLIECRPASPGRACQLRH